MALSFAHALRSHREKAGLKQSELAGKVGVTGPYISLLESGKRPPPGDAVTSKLEKAMELPARTLMNLAHIAKSPEDIRAVALKRIPLINNVTAGYPAEPIDLDYPPGVADEYVAVSDISDARAFAVTVCGDSMTPRFNEGDVLIISPAAAVKSGDFCFVRIDSHGETTGTFKQVVFEEPDVVRLVSLNTVYPPRTCKREELSGLWRAVRRLEAL